MNQFTSGSIRYNTIFAETERPAGPTRVAVVARRILWRFFVALYETRRRQAELIIARHRHLFADAESSPHRETKTKHTR